jgi:hypothetical protein
LRCTAVISKHRQNGVGAVVILLSLRCTAVISKQFRVPADARTTDAADSAVYIHITMSSWVHL